MKESTSVPFDDGSWNPTGLFVYEMHFKGEYGKANAIELTLPCLLQDAIKLGNLHRLVCEPRIGGGWWKPRTVQGLSRYEIGSTDFDEFTTEHVKRLPKTFLYDQSTNQFWFGSVRANLSDLLYAAGHVPEGHAMRATGLRMLGLDADDEKSYKPALVRAVLRGSGKTLVIPTYGAIESPCAALDQRVTPSIEHSSLMAFNNVVLNMDFITFVSIQRSTHEEHMAISAAANRHTRGPSEIQE